MWCLQHLLFVYNLFLLFTSGPSLLSFYSQIKVGGHDLRMCKTKPWIVFGNEWLDCELSCYSRSWATVPQLVNPPMTGCRSCSVSGLVRWSRYTRWWSSGSRRRACPLHLMSLETPALFTQRSRNVASTKSRLYTPQFVHTEPSSGGTKPLRCVISPKEVWRHTCCWDMCFTTDCL